MKQTNIKISKYVRDNLEEIEGGTFDKKLNNLIDTVSPLMPFVEYTDKRTNIKTSPETLEKLDTFRITSTESRDNIIVRMLIMFEELQNFSIDADEYTSFKLTNPYNNSLVLEGQIENNSRRISFNHRGYVYYEKLPQSYVVEGKDLTKELYIWYDNLNWNEISSIILDNKSVKRVITNKDYILDVNYLIKEL